MKANSTRPLHGRITIGRRLHSWLIALLLAIVGVQDTMADEWPEYITDVILVGGNDSETSAKKTEYKSKGYTFIERDLNEGAGGDYIYLGYKKDSRASTNGGYVTDIVVVTEGDKAIPTGDFQFGRTYKKVACYGGNYFVENRKGDLNSGAGGWGIWLYYSKEEYSSTKRALTSISFSSSTSGSVNCYNYYTKELKQEGINMNRGCDKGSNMYMHLSTTTKSNRPKTDVVFNSNRNYDCTTTNLIKTAATVESGTMYYRLNGGSWTTNASSLTAKAPGNYKLEYYVGSNSYGNASATKSYTVQINKDSRYVSPTNIAVSNENTYAKTLKLTWEKSVPSGATTNGKWYIYRGQEKVGETDYSKCSFDDNLNGVSYGTKVVYTVCFVPNSWQLSTLGDALSDVQGSINYTLKRGFSITSLTAADSNGKVKLTWNYSSILDASTTKNYEFKVERRHKTSTNAYSNWQELDNGSVYINNSSTTSSSFTDNTAVANQEYQYRVKIIIEENTVYSSDVTFRLDGSSITSFSASRGEFSNGVKLYWTVNQKGSGNCSFTIQRRPLSSTSESDWADIYATSGTVASYSYEDQSAQPGSFNEYRVVLSEKVNDVMMAGSSMVTDGFSSASGVVSGRVSFGSGTAVQGVRITMTACNADGQAESHLRSLSLTSNNVGIQTISSAEKISNLVKGDFSAQLYLLPDNSKMSASGTVYELLSIKDRFHVLMKYDATNQRYQLGAKINGTTTWTADSVSATAWNHLTVTHSNGQTRFYVVSAQGKMKNADAVSGTVSWNATGATNTLTLGNNGSLNDANHFSGKVDEFRFFTTALNEADILKNYNHTLAGSESHLAIYWPMDEGIANGQTMVYDFSRPNGVASGNHGHIRVGATSDTVVPSAEQLSLMAYTDENGNYTIRGIGFSGEGTSYVITPTLGIHQFSPTNQSRFFSQSSLVHSGVDFSDVSSFPVSGYIYYANTEYPVEGAQLYVDGNVCAKDGDVITTDASGRFEIDVPIGAHHISVQKSGHTFADNGRYPADPNNTGTKFNFNQEVKDLTFYDITTVRVAGRVAGGIVQQNEPVGLLQGKANIGQAKITLEVPRYRFNVEKVYSADGTSYTIETATADRPLAAVTSDVRSTASVGHTNADEARTITIYTDATTGEYAVELPPIAYDVKSVEIINNTDGITFSSSDLAVLDASDTTEGKDSAEVNAGMRYFSYDLKRNFIYRSSPQIIVTDKSTESTFFGEESYSVTNADGTTTNISLKNQNGSYRFGYPVFVQENVYEFDYFGYEEYVNHDVASAPVVDQVPLQGVELTIQNQFAGTTSVSVGQNGSYADGDIADSENDVLTLDSLGHATYGFTAGFPNIKGDHTLSLSASYAINGVNNDLEPMKAIVFGQLPTGNNFTTAGPDELLYVLRDPPGTHSYSYVEKGTTFESETSHGGTWKSDNELTTVSHLGFSETFLVGGIGLMKQTTVETVADLTVGLQVSEEGSSKAVKKHTVTTTQRIQTSDEDQFVGANGDVFIGSGTNLIFGKMRKVQPYLDDNGQWSIDMKEITSMGQKFSTNFFYTAQQIENSILPSYENMIAEILQPMGTIVSPNPAQPVYVSKLPADDVNFGRSNIDQHVFGNKAENKWSETNHTLEGPSYIAYFPANMEVISDTITWLNSQINSWKQTLANNEKVKLETKNSGKLENVSFDSGAIIEKTYTTEDYDGTETENTFMMSIVAGFQTGVDINKTGVDININTNTGGGHVYSHTEGDTESKTIGFVLADEGEDDKHSVDYGMAGDGYGYVFFTRGGQTSCPYEDAELTKYYQPGTELSAATMKVQAPKIRAEKTIVTNIPAGGTGEVTLLLSNDSEIGEDGWYDLSVVDQSNPDGLQFSMDGQGFAAGRTVYLPADNSVTRKTITVKQSKSDVLRYENVKLRIASQCQGDPSAAFPEIADTLAFTFEFAPTCSDIALAVDNKTVNNMTGPRLSLTISKYDLNQESLRGIKIQYMKGGNDWALAKEYVTHQEDVTNDKELLTKTGATYLLDMSNPVWTDGSYVFRAITECNIGGTLVNNESNEITVIKDMAQPMLIAMPTPTNGILKAGDELSVTFNEDIQYGDLLSTSNFYIRGQLNDREVNHDAAFQASGSAGASTDAAIDLAEKSFAVNLWLNWSQAGSFVNHGSQDNNFDAAITADGHLVVTVGGESHTSDNTIPKDKWNFVSISMEQSENGAVLNANAAYDDSEVILFQNKPTKAYTGNGKLEVGASIKGAIHEVTLWNEARSWAVAQSEMYTGKSPFTPALIGYWRMDEAHGTTAEDAARKRHMTLPGANAWHMENENHSLQLDGTDYVDLNIADITTGNTQDYAVELWLRADESQDGTASIMSMGNNGIDLRIAQSGALELEAKGTTYSVSTADLRDRQWHHIALNVLKSTNGYATVYVDGSQMKQIPASSMPALANDNMVLGGRRNIATPGADATFSQYLKGNIDEVRIWHTTMTGDMIRQNMFTRINPEDHDGLVSYYPLEQRALDQYNQIVTSPTLADQAKKRTAEAQVLRRTASGSEAMAQWSSSEAMAMKLAPTTQNVDFKFVGSDRKILITLNENSSRVEGCTLYFTVRSVRDMNGNLCEPITWTAVVNQHQMEWSETAVNIRKANAEVQTFDVDVRNASASAANWNITGLPSWLSVSAESGTLAAQSAKTITFTVAASTAVGKYEQVVYVSGDDGVQMPLVVNVVSEGETPSWTVNPTSYEFTMNIVGQLKIDDKLSEDTEDLIAAFNGTECVGIARPQYVKRYDAYFVMMTIYGNNDNTEDPISFKIYDASTGVTYPSVNVSSNIKFEKDNVTGSISAPVMWTPDNKVEQDIALSTGWNWISLNVEPADMTVGSVLKDINATLVKTSEFYAQHASDTWAGTLGALAVGKMYKLQANEDCELQVIGTPMVSTAIPINKGWNWLGVATSATLSPTEAFAGLNPQDGDIVKSQREFSMFSDGGWVGTLNAVVPGIGYLYSSEDATAKSFTYPAKGSTHGRKNAPRRVSSDNSDIELLEHNMNVILTVIDGNGQQRHDAVVEVSAYGQKRGETAAPCYGGEYFLTVQGKADDAEMELNVELDGRSYNVGTIVFRQDAVYGSVKQPVALVIGETTAIGAVSADSRDGRVYDLSGRRVSSEKLSKGQLNKGVYIRNGQKIIK